MIPDVDIFISNYTIVDPEVYQLWVDGCSAEDAVQFVHKNVCKSADSSLDLVKSDISDHYRTYCLLEKLLHNPPKLAEQLHFQIEPLTRQLLIEKYYEFDDSVIRELLGKKLTTSRYRKDLDEVSEKTGVSLKSCRRQFDNVKRIFKTVEDMPGSVIGNIRQYFLLPEELAKRYGAVVLLSYLRFETSKKKLQYLTFNDFYECALSIMGHWTYLSKSHDHDDLDLDREFLMELREIRCVSDREKELKHLICNQVRPLMLDKSYFELENNFRAYSRSIISIGYNLHSNRDLKLLFVDIVEKCVEVWRQVNWTPNDLKAFLSAYKSCTLLLDCFRREEMKQAWERYMTVLICCLEKMYHP